MSVRLIILALTFSFIARIVFAYFAPGQYQSFGDTEEYLEVAKRLCISGSYPFEHIFLPTFRAPGFPVFLALISGCLSVSVSWISVLLILMDSFTCIAGMGVVHHLSNTQKSLRAGIFGLAYSIYPLFIQQSVTIQSECLTVFAIIVALYLFLKKYPVLAGVFIGVAILTRPSALILFFLLSAGLLVSRDIIRRKIILTILGAVLTIFPWSLYASYSLGKFTLVNDSFCYSIYRGARLELIDVYMAKDPQVFKIASEKSEAVIRIAEKEIGDRSWCKETLSLFTANPSEEFRLAYLKFFAFFRPWPHSAAHNAFVVFTVGMVTVLLYGFYIFTLSQKSSDMGIRKAKWILSIYILLVGVFHMPHQVSNRYRVPFVDPLMLVMVAVCFKASKSKEN